MLRELISAIIDFFKDLFSLGETWFIIFIIGLSGIVVLPLFSFVGVFDLFLNVFISLWWFWLFFILFFSFADLFMSFRREIFKAKEERIFLEIKIPPNISKSPQAMENVFTILASFGRSAKRIKDKYFDGVVNNYFSLELVHIGNEINFLIGVPKSLKKSVEGAIFAYYPDVDIEEVEDYAKNFPENALDLETRQMEAWGGELVLEKEEAYPIKTYRYFESKDEDKQFDPISGFFEFMSKLNSKEFFGIQIIIEPIGAGWKEKFSKTLEKLKKESGEKQKDASPPRLSPGEVDLLKAVELNLSKQAFLTLIRFMYLSPRDSAENRSYVRSAVSSVFAQFGGLNLNSFKTNRYSVTSADPWEKMGLSFVYAKKKLRNRISKLLFFYKKRITNLDTFWGNIIYSYPFARASYSKKFYFTTEELASVFHLPSDFIFTKIHVKKLPSKKVPPPLGVPVFDENDLITKFK